MENKIDQLFCELIHDICSQLKNKFTSKDIHRKLKIKHNQLKKIIDEWIAFSVSQDKIELINSGKSKNGEITFMTYDYFQKILQQKMSELDFQLDENKTYLFLRELSQTDDPNIAQLIDKIEKFAFPLVRFDKGSRNVPIVLNLYKNGVPQRLVNVTQSIVDGLASESNEISEIKTAKKAIFKVDRTDKKGYDNRSIVMSAFSLMIMEIGKLVLSKEDIVNSRGYKVYFNTLDFEILKELIKTVYPFALCLKQDYISLFPENWLDIKRIKKQILDQEPESFLRKNFPYINDGEINTLMLILNIQPTNAPQFQVPSDRQTEPEKQSDSKNDGLILKEELDIKIKPVKAKKVQKHIASEPLKFLDEIIYRENGTESKDEKRDANSNTINPKDILNQLDKAQKHFLIRILDSTKMISGYYSHSINDEKFKSFAELIKEIGIFSIEIIESSYIIKRISTVKDSQFKALREELDISILENNERVEEEIKSTEMLASTEKKKATNETKEENKFEGFEINDEEAISNDFIIDQSPQTSKSEEEKQQAPVNEEEDTLIIVKNEAIEEPLELDEKEIDEIVENNFLKAPVYETPIHSDLAGQTDEKIITPNEAEDLQFLRGKVISVLTEDEERYLTIELISRSLDFQVRDGLAYKPDIAVLEESYRHLSPIAKNSGALVMPMKKFLNLIGLKESN